MIEAPPATIFHMLGIREAPHTAEEAEELIRTGLTSSAVQHLARALGLKTEEQVRIFDLSPATLGRVRGSKDSRLLSPGTSDRLFRAAAVAALAEDVFEGRERAVAWLRVPNPALQGKTPMELLDTDIGSRRVETVLRRLEYGIYS